MTARARLPVVVSGLVLWGFLVLVPAVHLGLLVRLPSTHQALALAPLVVLACAAVLRSRSLAVVLFPAAHLPLLLLVPALVGPRIYGLGAFLALAAATVAFLFAALSDGNPPARGGAVTSLRPSVRALALPTVALGVVGAVAVAAVHFHQPFRALLARSYPGYEDRAATFIGLFMFACWVVALVRHVVWRVGRPLLQRQGLLVQWYRFEAEALDRGRARASLGWALFVGALSGATLTAVLVMGK